jgi:PKD repeat protein
VGQVLTYGQEVTLEVGGVPLSMTGDISPPVVTPPGEAQLTLAVQEAAASGEYSLVITGTAQVTNVHTARLGLTVYEPPQVRWRSNSPVRLGQAMHFSATVSDTLPLTYTWDFGGAGSAKGDATLNPVYTYTNAGEFAVNLEVMGPCGAETVSDTVRVYAPSYLPLVLRPTIETR